MSETLPSVVVRELGSNPLVAVVRLPDLTAAVPLSGALASGGVAAIEFTLTSPGAYSAIEIISKSPPDTESGPLLVGAGSVTTQDEARHAISAGAQFVVSPVTDLGIIHLCANAGVACMPGGFTPTEILTAWNAGASVVKVFPAGVLGPGFLKDLLAPLPELRLMPTGGVDLGNVAEYIRCGAYAIGVGSSLVSPRLAASGDWDELTKVALSFKRAIAEARS